MRVQRGGELVFRTSLCPLPLINLGRLDKDWYEGITQKLKWNQCIREVHPAAAAPAPAGPGPATAAAPVIAATAPVPAGAAAAVRLEADRTARAIGLAGSDKVALDSLEAYSKHYGEDSWF